MIVCCETNTTERNQTVVRNKTISLNETILSEEAGIESGIDYSNETDIISLRASSNETDDSDESIESDEIHETNFTATLNPGVHM